MKFAKVAAVAAIALVLAACGQSDTTVPMDKLEMQFKETKASRLKALSANFTNLTITNVRCRTEKAEILCKVDGSGQVTYKKRESGVSVSEISEPFADKDFDIKFFNREAFKK